MGAMGARNMYSNLADIYLSAYCCISLDFFNLFRECHAAFSQRASFMYRCTQILWVHRNIISYLGKGKVKVTLEQATKA